MKRWLHLRWRSIRFWWQRRTRGWDDSETWSLDARIAEFTLPRLRRFKRLTRCYPFGLSEERWYHILDELIWFLEVTSRCEEDLADEERLREARQLWGEYFNHLWW